MIAPFIVSLLSVSGVAAAKETLTAALRKLFKDKEKREPTKAEEKELLKAATAMIRAATDDEIKRYDSRFHVIERAVKNAQKSASKKSTGIPQKKRSGTFQKGSAKKSARVKGASKRGR